MPMLEAGWMWPVDWALPPGVRAVMTFRYPGASAGGHGGFNLATHVGDQPLAVATNRQQLAAHLQARPVFLNQVHGVACVQVDAQTPDGTEGDAAFTTEVGVACTMMVADCLPVLMCDADGRQVAAAHAGWRGLVHGVLDSTVAAFAGRGASDLTAWLGPCIGPGKFEVGEDVRSVFGRLWSAEVMGSPWFEPHAKVAGKHWCDLAALARWQLARLGVGRVHGNDSSPVWCTASQPERWFSHRRDGSAPGGTGRMAACIWREGVA